MNDPSSLRLLALGDSYTIGTGASAERNNWPTLVGHRLSEASKRPVAVTNPAVNGYTTEDLIRTELPLLKTVRPDFVTVLIGANDIVRGRSDDQYRRSMRVILTAIAALGLPPQRVVGVSMPDWSISPAAAQFGRPAEIRQRIDAFNGIAEQECQKLGFGWVDISDLSRAGGGRAGWIAGDGLHPGDLQYAAWAERIWDGVRAPWLGSL